VTIDAARGAVYAAEDQWTAVLDRGGTVDFFGSTLTVPVQRRFGDLAAVRDYVRWVCTTVGISVPAVRARRGHTRAHYESASATIAIPGMDGALSGAWAARESVVLHEVAHHWAFLSHASLMHDTHYRTAMVEASTVALGVEAALILRAGYDGAVRG
jgi:putative metallohydrolase (TIGR04338 family)